MDIIKKEINKETLWQIYDFTFLSDLLEMIRGTCCIVNNDKKLNHHFTAIIDYLNSNISEIDGEILNVEITVEK